MSKNQIQEILSTMSREVSLIQGMRDEEGRWQIFNDFMHGLFTLGCHLHRNADAPPPSIADPVYDAIRAAIPKIATDVILYLSRLEDRFIVSMDSGDWERICISRSALAFWERLLGDVFPEYLREDFDCTEIDDHMREFGLTEGGLHPDNIPEGTPGSHWWWWYPDSPPT